MLYFKNSDLAYTYHVSVRTVRNWIESAKQGKLDLTLHTHGQRMYVSNTARNIATIERLVEEGKKYRPHRAVKTVTPKPEFYTLFHEAQIYDIVRSMELHHEIPRDYNYFDGGADSWDIYAQRLANEDTPNLLTSTIQLLDLNESYLDSLLAPYEKVNIVDIGVGNALPVEKLISHLLQQEKMGRYIGIDISTEMLKIASANIKKWFGDKVSFDGYDMDINRDRFANILADGYINSERKTANLILLLGGTLQNFRKPDNVLATINDSMNKDDFFISTIKLDTPSSRKYFDFSNSDKVFSVPEQNRIIIDMLNIDDSYYEPETGYDKEKGERYIRIKLKVALDIDVEFGTTTKKVSLNKDDRILLWRYIHQDSLGALDQLIRNDFQMLQFSQINDGEYLLTIAQAKAGS